jgi:hypothetical protein
MEGLAGELLKAGNLLRDIALYMEQGMSFDEAKKKSLRDNGRLKIKTHKRRDIIMGVLI